MRKQSHVPARIEYRSDRGTGAHGDLFNGFSTRYAVAEERPAGQIALDVVGGAPFVSAIIPLGEIRFDLCLTT